MVDEQDEPARRPRARAPPRPARRRDRRRARSRDSRRPRRTSRPGTAGARPPRARTRGRFATVRQLSASSRWLRRGRPRAGPTTARGRRRSAARLLAAARRRASWPSPLPRSRTRVGPLECETARGRICSSYSRSAPFVNVSRHQVRVPLPGVLGRRSSGLRWPAGRAGARRRPGDGLRQPGEARGGRRARPPGRPGPRPSRR